MGQQGYTSPCWMLRAMTLMMLMTMTKTMLPDFMFGWSAKETRTQAGRPNSGATNGASLLTRDENTTGTSSTLLQELIYQGDIKLRLEEAREILNAASNRRRRRKRKITAYRDKWWQLPIPYVFDDKLSFNATEKAYILAAVRYWEERTCIKFQEVSVNTSLKPVLLFRKENGCWSYVGKEKAFKLQEISIGEKCFNLGVMVHELGHAIGFWHEHSRPDRDEYITVNYTNVKPGESLNFEKESWRDLDNLNVPYDIGSVMHYSATAFSSNGDATVRTRKPLEQGVLGQRQSLSFYDAKQANLAYCNDTCKNSPVKGLCKNEGYPDPNDCSRCRCPDGLTGNTCQTVAPSVVSCGGVIQILGGESYTIVTPGYPNRYPAGVECNWLIKAGEKKVVKLAPIDSGFLQPQPYCHDFGGRICDEDYVEIKYRVSMAKTGARFCCGKGPTTSIQSEGNTMMALFRTRNAGAGGFIFIVSSESCGGCMESTPSDQPACMVQEKRWCPKMWTYKKWVPCTIFFNIGQRCGIYQTRTAYRVGYCLRKVGKCCKGFKLFGERCIKADPLPVTAALVTSTQGTGTDSSSSSGLAIGNDDIDKGWSTWSAWSSCSLTCGGCGIRERKRTCSSQSNSCSGVLEETKTSPCQDNLCPSNKYLCQKTTQYKEQCLPWVSTLCTRYKTRMDICDTVCCSGYSKSNGKCVKDPS